MKYTTPGQHRTLQEFRAHLRDLDPDFDADPESTGAQGPLGQPLRLGERIIGNRFAAHPMEGRDGTAEGLPSELTLRRWRGFGRSTAKLVWGGEAYAVREDGRSNPRQLYRNPAVDAVGGLVQLREAVLAGHREMGATTDDLFVGLQITHSARFARPHGEPAPRIVVRHPALARHMGLDPEPEPLTDGELEEIGECFVATARDAREAGFDFIDLKCCHGYLLHELLGAHSRPGIYGGDLAGRTRFARRVLAAIHDECPGLEVAVRLSVADVYPHTLDRSTGEGRTVDLEHNLPYRWGFGVDAADPLSFDLREPLEFMGELGKLGVRLVNVTLGSPYYCAHLQRPAVYAPGNLYLPPRDPLLDVLDHLRVVRACKAAHPELLLVGSGYTYLMEWLPHVAQHEVGAGHVDFVGLGRMMLSYPELPADVLAGRKLDRKRICRTFSECTGGADAKRVAGCYPLDQYYKALGE